MDSTRRHELNAIAATQHGHVTARQAGNVGIGSGMLTSAIRRGELERVRPGVYGLAGMPRDWKAQLMADVLAAPRGAWASHSSALRLHGVRHEAAPFRREIVTISKGVVHVDDAVIVHRTRTLSAADRTTVDGVPSATLARTMVDLGRSLEHVSLLELLDTVICTGPRGTRLEINRAAQRLHLGRRNGLALVEATGEGAEAAFRSWLERTAAPLVVQAGLHDAVWNQHLPGVAEAGVVDTLSPSTKVIVEWKGLAFHRQPEQLQRDSDKQNAAQAAGYVVVTFTWSDVVRRPAHVVALLHRFATAAAAV